MAEAPDVTLLRAMMDALRADATVSGFVGGRIYDRVPQKENGDPAVSLPYISFGPTDEVPDDYDCLAGAEITVQIDVWSQGAAEAFSSVECRRIAEAVKRTLHDEELTLTDNALVTLQLALKRMLREPDGITSHAVLQFTATIETP